MAGTFGRIYTSRRPKEEIIPPSGLHFSRVRFLRLLTWCFEFCAYRGDPSTHLCAKRSYSKSPVSCPRYLTCRSGSTLAGLMDEVEEEDESSRPDDLPVYSGSETARPAPPPLANMQKSTKKIRSRVPRPWVVTFCLTTTTRAVTDGASTSRLGSVDFGLSTYVGRE